MTTTKKILSIFLCILMILNTCSVSFNVFAQELNETNEEIENIADEETEENEEVYILSEITEERTAYTKTFRMSDGSFTLAQYTQPVHFLDEDAQWQDYDNSFEENDGLYTTASRKNPISLSLKAKQGETVFVEDEEYPISWGYNNIKSSKLRINNKNEKRKGDERFTVLDNLTQSAEYKNVYPHVDIEYTISSSEVKENLVLNSKNTAVEYQITYNIGSLAAVQVDSKTIELKNGDETIYTISAPIMYDNNDEISEDLFISILEEQNGVLTVGLTIDSVWLKAKDRAFPVVVDPAFVVDTDFTTTHTAFVSSGTPNTNHTQEGSMELGYESSINKNCRVLMKFVLPTLNPGDMIVSSQVNFYIRSVGKYIDSTSSFCVSAHTVTSSWDTSVENSDGTFNSKSGTVTWNTQPTFDSTVLDYVQIDCNKSGYWEKCDITSVVKGWYEGTFKSYGILLKSYYESQNPDNDNKIKVILYSERYAKEVTPCLTVVYRNNKGLEDYWTYTSIDSGTAGTANINDYSGNLVLVHNTANTPGLKMPVSINHVYNGYMFETVYSSSYPKIGRGWKLNIQQTVKPSKNYGLNEEAQKSYPYAYEDGDGTVHFFYKKDGKYYDEDGLGLELKVQDSGYTITDKKDNVMTFGSRGNLKTVADVYGNKMTVSYSTIDGTSVINKVTDGADHVITFTYNESTLYLQKITEPDGRETTFKYGNVGDSGHFLTKITYPDGTSSTYHYNTKKHLAYSISSDGTGLYYKYDSGKNTWRVNTVAEKVGYVSDTSAMTTGQKITFDRSEYNMTVMRTSGIDAEFDTDDDILTTYQFDNYGRTVSVNSRKASGTNLGANAYTYTAGSSTSNLKQINKVTSASGAGKHVYNFLKNHSAESDGSWSASYWVNSSATYSAAYSSSYSLYGKKSLKINVTKTDSSGGGSYQQSVTDGLLKAGDTYTLSAYVKINDALTSANSVKQYGACVAMRFVLEDGSTVRQYSAPVAETVNGWQRLVLTDTVPENTASMKAALLVINAKGTAYFDGIQLEKTDGPSEYNLLENAGFETVSGNLPSSWTASGFTSSDVSTTSTKKSGSYSVKMVGDPNTDKKLYQTIALSGSASEEDTYILTGWAKATSVPVSSSRLFDMEVKITYSDSSTHTSSKKVQFNDNYFGWQFASAAFSLSDGTSTVKTPTKLTVYIRYGRQANAAYFDGISLFKDNYNAYSYDSEGNLQLASSSNENTSSMKYDSSNNLTSVVNAENNTYKYTYNNKHSVTEAVSPMKVKYEYTYNTDGTLKSTDITNSSGSMKIHTGQVLDSTSAYVEKLSDQDGYYTTYTRNTKNGNVTSVKTPDGTITNYDYKAKTDLVTKVTTGSKSVSYAYDATNTKLTEITHNGFTYGFIYDKFGNVTKTSVGGQNLATNTYQAQNGSLEKVTYGNGDYNEYVYGSYGNLTTVKKNGSTKYKWYYNNGINTGHLDSVNKLKYTYVYDLAGRIVQQGAVSTASEDKIKPYVYNTQYKYNTLGNVSAIYNTIGGYTYNQKFEYDKDGRPTLHRITSTRATTYSYDSIGRLNKQLFSADTPVETNYIYWLSERNKDDDETYRTTKIKREVIGNIGYAYTYDKMGNILTVKEGTRTEGSSSLTGATQKLNYTYDAYGQLVREDNKYLNKSIVYAYDAGGNITSKKEYAYTTGTLGTATKTISYTYGDSNWKDKLTKYDGTAITYDAIGNPLSYRGMTMTWQGRQLTKAVKGKEATIKYTYDADGLRASKTVDGIKQTFQYLGGKLMYENRGDGKEFYYTYDSFGNLSSIRYYVNGEYNNLLYAVCNSRGDVEALYGGSGKLVARYIYDTWGNTISILNSSGKEITDETTMAKLNRIRYRGYYWDEETGLYYLQSRYYDPVTCRFVNADSQLNQKDGILGFNMFAYCNNNPVMYADETGCIPRMVSLSLTDGGVGNAGIPKMKYDSAETKAVYEKRIKTYIDEYDKYLAPITSISVSYVGEEHIASKFTQFVVGSGKVLIDAGISIATGKILCSISATVIPIIYGIGEVAYDTYTKPDLPPGDYSVYHVSVVSKGIGTNGTFKKHSEFIGLNSFDVYIAPGYFRSIPNKPIYAPVDPAYYYYIPVG